MADQVSLDLQILCITIFLIFFICVPCRLIPKTNESREPVITIQPNIVILPHGLRRLEVPKCDLDQLAAVAKHLESQEGVTTRGRANKEPPEQRGERVRVALL